MRIFMTLWWREVFERRLLILVSAFLGFVPIVVPWLPGSPQRYTPEDLRVAVALVLVTLFAGVSLLILGSNIFGRDLSEGRLGFYFSRPISPWALWLARLSAAASLLLTSVVLIAAPTAAVDFDWTKLGSSSGGHGHAWPLMGIRNLFGPGIDWQNLPQAPPVGVQLLMGLGALFLLLAVVHLVSSIARARSSWQLADLAALAGIIAIGWAARDILVREQALGALVWAEWILLVWVLGAVLLAGAQQLRHGRTDLRRGHLFLSLTLWPTLLVAALGFVGFARWVETSKIEDLTGLMTVVTSPDEEWLWVGGPVRYRAGATAAFLLDTRSGVSWRMGTLGVVRAWTDFSDDGSTVAWGRCESLAPLVCELWTKDLRDPVSDPRQTRVAISSPPNRMVLSRNGGRVAFLEDKRLVVHDLSSARLVMAVEAEYPEAVEFLSESRLRFHEQIQTDDGWKTRIRRLDLDTRQVVDTGRLPRGLSVRRNPHGNEMLYKSALPASFGLYSSDSGEPVVEFSDERLPSRGRFLADGRIVMSFHDTRHIWLQVLSPEGEELHRIERPGVRSARFGGEIVPGRVLVALRDVPAPPAQISDQRTGFENLLSGWTAYVLDADTGELSQLAESLVPLGVPAEILPKRLFLAGGRSVIQWDAATGEQRVILQPFERHKGDESPLPLSPVRD